MNICVVVDYQYDFLDSMHGGALPVPGGWEIEDRILYYTNKADFVIGTRDWHPWNHSSFQKQGGPHPGHCVKGSSGAVIVSSVDRQLDVVISKGQDVNSDGYSAAENPAFMPILRTLAEPHHSNIWVVGLATDYCIPATAIPIAREFERVFVPSYATKGVDERGTIQAIHRMEAANVIYDRFA
jgi:nicotinamidase/pyrazinamidase